MCCCDWRWELFAGSVLDLLVLVPYYNWAITSKRSKRVVLSIECNTIYSIDGGLWWTTFCFFSMTLKTEVLLFESSRLRNVVVLDTTASFYGAHDITFSIAKDRDSRGRELQRRCSEFSWIPLIRLEVFLQVPNVNEPVLMRCHKQRPLKAHIVHWHS